MTQFQFKCHWKIREFELVAQSSRLKGSWKDDLWAARVTIPVTGALRLKPNGMLQLVFSSIWKTRLRGDFAFHHETKHKWSVSSSCLCNSSVCNHCSIGLNDAFKGRFQVSDFHQWPAGWLGSALPEWSSSVLSQSESSYRPWWEERQEDVKQH